MYSTIKHKEGICFSCPPGTETKRLIKGMCQFHYWGSVKKKSLGKELQKIQNGKNGNVKTGLDLWFEERRKEMKNVCENCGGKTFRDNEKMWKFSICHILPKRSLMFPSVSTNKFNWVELCWTCHQEMDATYERMSKMKCFPVVIKKLNLFYNDIAPNELGKLSSYIANELDKINV